MPETIGNCERCGKELPADELVMGPADELLCQHGCGGPCDHGDSMPAATFIGSDERLMIYPEHATGTVEYDGPYGTSMARGDDHKITITADSRGLFYQLADAARNCEHFTTVLTGKTVGGAAESETLVLAECVVVSSEPRAPEGEIPKGEYEIRAPNGSEP